MIRFSSRERLEELAHHRPGRPALRETGHVLAVNEFFGKRLGGITVSRSGGTV